ncbi:MAG: CAP domain-containing protein [Deltaproteobacteria bacterium]|nr:CAP domain-containing protein [Deltaproteobacteria bacterium]
MATIVPMNTNHLQKIIWTLCILLLTNVLLPGATPSAEVSSPEKSAEATETEAYLHDSINRIRKEHRLPALKASPALRQIARSHSRFMASTGYLGHGENGGRDFRSRIEKAKVKGWRTLGENVARSMGYRNNADVLISGWMQSKPHRKNILSADFNLTGIGTAEAADGTLYATQVFMGSDDQHQNPPR